MELEYTLFVFKVEEKYGEHAVGIVDIDEDDALSVAKRETPYGSSFVYWNLEYSVKIAVGYTGGLGLVFDIGWNE